MELPYEESRYFSTVAITFVYDRETLKKMRVSKVNCWANETPVFLSELPQNDFERLLAWIGKQDFREEIEAAEDEFNYKK